MTQESKDKIAKVYELVKRGVDGEKDAAKLALDRLMKKYDLDDSALEKITFKQYVFKYVSDIEVRLLCQLYEYFISRDMPDAHKNTWHAKEIVISLQYLDYVVLSSSYEYFRRHMKTEYNRLVLPRLKRCRKVKTRNALRKSLSDIFFSNYILASKIYIEDQIKALDMEKMSQAEMKRRVQLMGVNGGEYNTQVTTGLYLEQ